jgi:hypothetical protein
MFPPVPVVLPRAFLLHADHGCGGHPAFPAPSCFARVDRFQRLGHFVSRERSLSSSSAVMPRFVRGIQYAAASPPKHRPSLEYLIVRSYPIESGTGAGRRRSREPVHKPFCHFSRSIQSAIVFPTGGGRARRRQQGHFVSKLRIAITGFDRIARTEHVPAIAATQGVLARWRTVEAFEDHP